MGIFSKRCKHRNLGHPVRDHRSCLDCGTEVPFKSLTLTKTDRQQAAAIESDHDSANVTRVHQKGVVADIDRRRQSK